MRRQSSVRRELSLRWEERFARGSARRLRRLAEFGAGIRRRRPDASERRSRERRSRRRKRRAAKRESDATKFFPRGRGLIRVRFETALAAYRSGLGFGAKCERLFPDKTRKRLRHRRPAHHHHLSRQHHEQLHL